MNNKISIIAAYRKTRLVYKIGNSKNLYHIDIQEVGDLTKPNMGFRRKVSQVSKFKIMKKGS